ncbi:MAG: DUF433 domain-containing protein [Planctomycetota bacterium]|nr:DUF433 domain-containing protein [Planctomycetota bacterium]MDA1214565.1 DUF433 domain-containing protein [Planctomycetota bacterium]
MSTDTRYEHIELNDDGVPMISGTTMKVVELVLNHLAYGWSPAELHFQFPYLTLGMIHSALAYYWDHQQEIDEDIERRDRLAEEIMVSLPVPPLVKRLRAQRQQ